MKLDETKVYSLEGMIEKQIIKLFKDNNIKYITHNSVHYKGQIASNFNIIFYRKSSKRWYWVLFEDPSDVIKVVDLIK